MLKFPLLCHCSLVISTVQISSEAQFSFTAPAASAATNLLCHVIRSTERCRFEFSSDHLVVREWSRMFNGKKFLTVSQRQGSDTKVIPTKPTGFLHKTCQKNQQKPTINFLQYQFVMMLVIIKYFFMFTASDNQ